MIDDAIIEIVKFEVPIIAQSLHKEKMLGEKLDFFPLTRDGR